MATIPRNYAATIVPSVTELPRARPGLGLAEGLQNTAQSLDVLAQGVEKRDNARDISFVAQQSAADRLAMSSRLDELMAQAPPDGSGVNDTIQQEMEQRRLEAVKTAPSDKAAAALDMQYAELRTNIGLKAQSFEAVQRGKYTVAQLDEAVGTEAAHLAFHPEDFDSALKRVDTTTLALANDAKMNPAALSAYRKRAYADLALSKLHGELLRNPVVAYADIASGKYDQYFAAAPEKLGALLSSTLTQFTEMQNQAYTQQQREKKLVEDETFKAGLKVLETPGANVSAFVDQHWANLDPEAIKYLTNQKDKGPVVSNREIYAALLLESTQHDNSASVQAHFLGGDLAQSDYDRLMSNATSGGVGSVYKAGEKYITTKIAPTFGETNFSGKQDRTAAALDKWRQWTIDHPTATDAEARQRYLDIGEEYKMLDIEESAITLGLPRFHVGGKFNLNLNATYKKTEDAHNNREISDAEFAAESRLINQWHDVQNPNATPLEPKKAAK